jgi:sortase A
VDVGDIFTVVVLGELMTYQVDQIHIVLPQELDDLDIVEGEDYCTLVTCTPYGINTHRMLVRGHRVDNAEVDTVSARVTADAIQVNPLIVTFAVAVPMLLIFIAVVVLQSSGTKKRR